MGQIFVSYKHEKQTESFVKELKQKLEDAHFDVWIDSELLLAGQDWKKEIDNAIKASIALIVIMTPEAFKSQYVTYEWAFGIGRGMEVIPLMLVNTKLHSRLNDLQFIDFSNHFDQPWGKLIQRLEIIETGITSSSREIPPFVKKAVDALDSYEVEDREEAINRLMKSNHPAATEALAEAVEHHIKDVRIYAAIKLARRTKYKDSRCISGLVEGSRGGSSDCLKMLATLGTIEAIEALFQLIPIVVRMIGNSSVKSAFQNISNPDCLSLLIHYGNEKDGLNREFAFTGLAALKAPESIPFLIEALSTFDNESIIAAETLGNIGNDSAVPKLSEMLFENLDDEQLASARKRAAAFALSKIDDVSSINALVSALEKQAITWDKVVIIEALSATKNPFVVPILISLLSDNSDIWKFPSNHPFRPKPKSIAEVAIEGLEQIGTPEALEAVTAWKRWQEVK